MAQGMMGGGLLNSGPVCPNDKAHGQMEQIPHEWALAQISRTMRPDGTTAAEIHPNNFGVRIYRCVACGLVQLYDGAYP
jgi:hypothetical protein